MKISVHQAQAVGAKGWRTRICVYGVLLGALNLPAAEVDRLLDDWFDRQSRLQRWQADFVQTRRLEALNEPLTTPGRVWFKAPDQFRWELGDPAKTIAVRQPNQLLVIYPRLKTVERYSLEPNRQAPWRSALTLLEAGFPQSRRAFEERFRVNSLEKLDEVYRFELEPRSATVRQWMPRIAIELSMDDFQLEATELEFADGSVLRNDFDRQQVNAALAPALFEPEIGSEYRRVEPGKEGKK